MNKATFDPHVVANHGLRRLGIAARDVALPIPPQLDSTALVQLFTQLARVDAEADSPVIQFVSTNPIQNSEHVAFDMAWAAAAILGRRILVLNGGAAIEGLAPTRTSPSMSLKDYMSKVNGLSLYVIDLHNTYGGARALAAIDDIIGNLRDLSSFFDMIVVAAPAFTHDSLASVLASHIDGSVLVLDAGQTRTETAQHAVQILSSSGSKILGAILCQ